MLEKQWHGMTCQSTGKINTKRFRILYTPGREEHRHTCALKERNIPQTYKSILNDSRYKLHVNYPYNTLESPHDATTPWNVDPAIFGPYSSATHVHQWKPICICPCLFCMYAYSISGQHRHELPYKSYMYICTGAPGVSSHAYLEYWVKIVAGNTKEGSMVINYCLSYRLLKFINLHSIINVFLF